MGSGAKAMIPASEAVATMAPPPLAFMAPAAARVP